MALKPKAPRVPKAAPVRPPLRLEINDRYRAFVDGELTVEDLDDEEIYRGQIKNKLGDFRGRPPTYVPRVFAVAMQQEAAKRFQRDVQSLIPDAIEAIRTVLNKAHPQPGDGAVVNAAFKTIERFAGRVPETLQIKGEIETWEQHMGEVIVQYKQPELTTGPSTDEADSNIVEAEVVE